MRPSLSDTTKDDLIEDCVKSFAAFADKYGFRVQHEWLDKLNREQLDNLSTFLDDLWREIVC